MGTVTIAVVVVLALDFVNTGAFLAFTTMVSPALRDAAEPRAAADLMRDINLRAPRSLFMVPFIGAPLAAVFAGVLLVTSGGAEAAPWMIAAIAATLLAFVVSVAVNIPWNDRLARERDRGATWSAFTRTWSRANTLRCVLSFLGAVAATVALV
ncbi:DUF1772 domain-containing protein [Pseudactinotalea suaedae]|uniref:DUF1772 domain-containing protein n=1 Tax=Pseudactinotalea suaedae TaxID=1524924 RepID=UPI0012E1A9DF|nr:DUF1772 domain-containing protein [Pseudactinotalea suaedae]